LLPAIPLILTNTVYTNAAIAARRNSGLVGLFVATASLALVLDYLAGRSFGTIGIAAAIVMRETGMFLGFRLLWPRPQASEAQQALNAASVGAQVTGHSET